MKYLSIDIETGGLDPEDSILELGMVWDDLEKGVNDYEACRIVMIPTDVIAITPYCCRMHRDLIDEIVEVQQADWWKNEMEGSTWARIGASEEESITGWTTYYVKQGFGYQAFAAALNIMEVPWKDQSIILAGKNIGLFDIPRLELHGWFSPNGMEDTDPPFRYKQRVLDPAMLFLRSSDEVPPSLSECIERAGLASFAPHKGIEEAIIVADLIRIGLSVVPPQCT